MSKQGEIAYFSAVGEHGQEHASGKPFSDSKCGVYLARIGQVMALLPPAPARVLDMGCGPGWTSLFLTQAGYEVVGVDISPDMIEVARRSAKSAALERVTFEVADYESLGASEEFDAVLFFDSLHHAEDERKALESSYRALRTGGVCITSEPGIGHHQTRASLHATQTYGVTEKEMPPTKIVRMGRKIGFSQSRVRANEGHLITLLSLPHDSHRGGVVGFFLRVPLLRALMAVGLILGLKHLSGVVVMTK